MTKVFDGVTVLTYEEWINKPEVAEYLSEIAVDEDCENCDGTGEHECDCGDVHDCHECNGSGTLLDARGVYEEDLRNEIRKMISWKETVQGGIA